MTSPVTALARPRRGEKLAVGAGRAARLHRSASRSCRHPGASPRSRRWPSAMAARPLPQGSARHRASDWAVDLMEQRIATGSVWRIDLRRRGPLPWWCRISPFPTACWRESGERARRRRRAGNTGSLRLSAGAGGAPQRRSWKSCRAIPARLSPASATAAPGSTLLRTAQPTDRIRPAGRYPILCWQMMRSRCRGITGSRRSLLPPVPASSSRCNAAGVKTMGIHKPWSPPAAPCLPGWW